MHAIEELTLRATDLRSQRRFTESRDLDSQASTARAALQAFDAARPTQPAKATKPAAQSAKASTRTSVPTTLEEIARDLRRRGEVAAAVEVEQQIPSRAAAKHVPAAPSSRPSAPDVQPRPRVSKDPRLAKMDAVVQHALGNGRFKLGTKTIGNTQYAGVSPDFDPYAA